MSLKLNLETYLKVIDKLLKDKSYHYAADTLNGIRDTIEDTGKVTKGQITAINNIRRGADRI